MVLPEDLTLVLKDKVESLGGQVLRCYESNMFGNRVRGADEVPCFTELRKAVSDLSHESDADELEHMKKIWCCAKEACAALDSTATGSSGASKGSVPRPVSGVVLFPCEGANIVLTKLLFPRARENSMLILALLCCRRFVLTCIRMA